MGNITTDLYNLLLLLYDAASTGNITVFRNRNKNFCKMYDKVFGNIRSEPDTLEGMFDMARNRLCDYLSFRNSLGKEFLEETYQTILTIGGHLTDYRRGAA